ncbi:apolipoprotein B-100-like [Gigantopelta aegis]|uniref:apolipoprotein B-100-like n=1 Tax=Gigantopelta aegis TaxID=1735272 RepID=UPI001B88E648|nr:apolipoprotein B-100-like [Gigantopelta aegis]
MTTMQLWLVAVLVAGALAGPILVRDLSDATMCARRCTGSNKFKFTPGMTYEFDYNVMSETTMEGADTERASIEIRAVADIEVLSQCDFALRMRDVSVFDTSSPERRNMDLVGEFRAALERNILRFSFQDGVVEDVCPADNEVTWALNFKRGVLSSIQNSMDNLEKDQVVHEKPTDIERAVKTK